MAYSENCKNLTTYWDTNKNNCVSCINRFPWPEAGKGFTANCGLSDDEGRHVNEYENCSSGTYNNGSFLSCQKCSPCSSVVVRCTPIADTQCYVKHTTATYKDDSTPMQVMTRDFGKWIIIPIILVALFLFYIIRRRIITNRAPELQMVPLQLLLDNMDVLEDLLILLDPDCSGLKNTRHLAARCHFSSTWINYAYSKRDSKSPLVAVLEAIAARSPEWTVGQLAWLLHDIDRHDAVNVLKKFSQPQKV
ncbi:IGF-like family receptor 1 isoform X2 [Alosa pseudoharengus]|uniref:IGF-like family receptor 1 isoform X2 n=1 Tax=Alosa pseudoharengus TaxID=34774 RepID=UPI003F8B92B5